MPIDRATAKVTARAANVTAPVTTPVANAGSVANPEPVKVGSVRLRDVCVSLDTDVGQALLLTVR